MRDYYMILGVPRNATTEEIKKAYRRLAKKYHPDSGRNRAADRKRFHEISEAYQVLVNPETRRRYNSWGHETYTRMKGQTSWEAWEFEKQEHEFHHEHGDGHCGACGGHGHDHEHGDGHCGACGEHRHAAKDDGPPPHMIRTAVHMSFRETLTGAEKTVQLMLANGRKRSVRVRIPKRTYHHCYYVLDDVLCPDEEEVLQKNIIVIVLIDDEAGFERQSCHLYSTRKVDFVDLVLGGVIEIETIDGMIPCEVKPGTANGTRITMQGHGLWMPPKAGNRGNHYVTLEVEIPRGLNAEQKAALYAFRRAGAQRMTASPADCE